MQIADLWAGLSLKPDEASWKRGDALIQNVKRGLGFFIGFEAVKWIGELVTKTADAAIGAERLSQKLGVSAESIQELGYAARVSGVEAEQLQIGMQKLAKGLYEAATKGTGPVAETFAKLGISMQNPAVKSKDLGQTIELLAEKFKAMPDNATKTALAIELFGKSGTALIPLLNQGKDGIEAFRQEAEDLGIVLDQKTGKEFEKFEEDQIRVKASLEGLRNTAVKALLPALQEMVSGLVQWIKANKEVIASTIKGAVEALILVFKVLGAVVGVIVDVFEWFKEHTEIAEAALVALGVVIGVFALQAAAAWIVGFFPIVAVIAAITAVILIIKDLWASITTGKGVAASAFRWVARQAHEFWEGLKSIGRHIADFFTGVGHGIKQAFSDAFDWVVAKAKAVGNTLRNMPVLKQLGDAGEWIGNKLAGGDGSSGTDDIDEIRVAAPNRQQAAGAAGVQSAPVTNNVNTTMNVSSPNADPKAVANIVQDKIAEHWDLSMRAANAATGGADSR